MFEDYDREDKNCKNCRWWEYEKTITTRYGERLKIGICQTCDEERNERRRCRGWTKIKD